MRRSILVGIIMAIVGMLGFSLPALAATSDTVTINATPAYIGIAVTEAAWTVNAGGTSLTTKNTKYYATDTNTDAEPAHNPVTDADCLLNLTNTSNIHTDITITCTDFSNGDAWTNEESKSNAANGFAMISWFTGDAWVDFATSGVIVKKSGSSVGKSDLGEGDGIQFGIGIFTPSGVPASPTAQSATLTVSAAAH